MLIYVSDACLRVAVAEAMFTTLFPWFSAVAWSAAAQGPSLVTWRGSVLGVEERMVCMWNIAGDRTKENIMPWR